MVTAAVVAVGGKDKLSEVKDMRAKGKMKLTTRQTGSSYRWQGGLTE